MRVEKTQLVKDIGKMLNESSFLFFVSYKGLKVKDFTEFRTQLAKHSAECHVLKNSLIKKAAELNGLKAVSALSLKYDTALVSGNGDPSAVAKAIDEFLKKNEVMAPKCGYIDGCAIKAEDIKAIASLPSKEQLQAQLLGLLLATPSALVTVLNAKVGSIVNVLNAYKNKLGDSQN